jgi:hypothetical protein
MFQRFKDSIVTPARIVEYRNDHLIWVLLYILFFALLLSTRMIIDVVTYDGVSLADQRVIARELPDLDPDCGFQNYEYICDTEATTLLYNDTIIGYYLDSHDTLQYASYESQYNIVAQGDSMYFLFNGNLVFETTLDCFGDNALANLDFSLQDSDPDQFEQLAFGIVDDVILSYQDFWGPILIAVDILTGIILFLAFILLSAMMMRFRFKEVPYRQMFVMNAYSATALYLILIFNSLFNKFLFTLRETAH